MSDEFDPLLIEYFRKQPRQLTPIQAFRQTIKDAAGHISTSQRRAIRERMELIMSIPELRGANMSQTSETLVMIAGLIAEREGKSSSDLAELALAGAIVGAVLGAHMYCVQHPEADYIDVIEQIVAKLDDGF
nr:hypothetical protein [Cohnella mopanensis]